MFNYSCRCDAVTTSSAERVYNDHRDCWKYRDAHSDTNTLPQEYNGAQRSRDPSERGICHWPASSNPVSPVSSLALIITTSLCLLYTLHPLPLCHTQIALSIRIVEIVCVRACVCMCFKGHGRSESLLSLQHSSQKTAQTGVHRSRAKDEWR